MKQNNIFFLALIVFLDSCSTFYASVPEEPQKIEPIKIGNLALAASQLPGPLFAFGELLIEKGDVIGFAEYDGLRGRCKSSDEILAFGAYGIRDNCSLAIYLPYALRIKENCVRNSGMEDILVALEYAFFDKPTLTSYNWASVVGGVFFPSGSINLEPPTGFGSHGFFIGVTLVHLGIDWYYFTSQGAIVTNKKNGIKVADEYLYQFGLGHNIKSPKGWIFMGMLELFGFYIGNDIVDNKLLCDHESNYIFLAPSFFASNERFSMHAGVGYCIYQHVPPGVNKDHYFFAVEFGWKFDGPALRGKKEIDPVK